MVKEIEEDWCRIFEQRQNDWNMVGDSPAQYGTLLHRYTCFFRTWSMPAISGELWLCGLRMVLGLWTFLYRGPGECWDAGWFMLISWPCDFMVEYTIPPKTWTCQRMPKMSTHPKKKSAAWMCLAPLDCASHGPAHIFSIGIMIQDPNLIISCFWFLVRFLRMLHTIP